MTDSNRLMRLFGRIRNDLKALRHSRRDRLRDRLIADITETLQLIEFETLVKPELKEQQRGVTENVT